ncbi:geranylgeranyl pyrophosphate synthetase [Aspergillus uvarum CBS 121591]|uniref:Geranylgeranyl pyrophosphate synthetase n=1 Tax=Aspergillus uvarum CBS 121591 TaxID=1448315 RepID=A0A319CK44_9EURO|nr:geranylgeranyl pyrophosphate synthetase [Aspergillus uvarum CBS 121591]PYH85594.1 geranylgeranyl pyrophosphate synthetase [Aspergillus uvarum CBS 121591]
MQKCIKSDVHPKEQTARKMEKDTNALNAPKDYISSLPSKNVRAMLLLALNVWFHLSAAQLAGLTEIISQLHNASLILDDIQDQSPMRRGQPSTHMVFGVGQSTNTATFMIVETLKKLDLLVPQSHQAQEIMHTGLKALFTGQSWDLNWKQGTYCPTREQYLEMVAGKTGALFQLVARLMFCLAGSESAVPPADSHTRFSPHPHEDQKSLIEACDAFMHDLGVYFQVRDDYRNLHDASYTAQKGFCEDLDEGKFSYPVVLCCEINHLFKKPILELFGGLKYKRRGMELEGKRKVLAMLEKSGAMESTEIAIQAWENKLLKMVAELEKQFGCSNPALREILKRLAA